MIRNGEFKQLIRYKRPFVLGHDVSGVVVAVGSDVRDFSVGDEVYSRPRDLRIGTFAELIAIDADDLARKPATLSFAEAAAVPLVALAAWQALVDIADVRPGQKVLVHAGAGGLGSTMIQVAKHRGAYVAHHRPGTGHGHAEGPRGRRGDRLHVAGLLPGPVGLRRRHRLPWRSQSRHLTDRPQARRPGHQRRGTAGPVLRHAARPSALQAGHDDPEPRRPPQGEEAGRALRVHVHEGERGAARDDRHAVRRRHAKAVVDRTFSFADTLDAIAYVEHGKAKGKIVITHDH
jgi:hypothetical protein